MQNRCSQVLAGWGGHLLQCYMWSWDKVLMSAVTQWWWHTGECLISGLTNVCRLMTNDNKVFDAELEINCGFKKNWMETITVAEKIPRMNAFYVKTHLLTCVFVMYFTLWRVQCGCLKGLVFCKMSWLHNVAACYLMVSPCLARARWSHNTM